jgi:hypothetical protein
MATPPTDHTDIAEWTAEAPQHVIDAHEAAVAAGVRDGYAPLADTITWMRDNGHDDAVAWILANISRYRDGCVLGFSAVDAND